MPQKIIYIYGIGYSGSTILDLILGLHSQIIGFGELYPFLEEKRTDFNKTFCACGRSLSKCKFWSGFQNYYEKNFEKEYPIKYKKFIEYFQKVYGQNKIIVDSSKRAEVLNLLISNFSKEIDFKIIYLLRDVRGFSLSTKIYRKEKGKWGNIPLYQIAWWQRNKKFKKFLEKNKLNYLQIGYEELCFFPEFILKKICNFGGVDFDSNMLNSPLNSQSHTVYGNIIALKPKEKEKLKYDNKWFRDYKVNLFYALFPFVAKWNNQNVYKNIKNQK